MSGQAVAERYGGVAKTLHWLIAVLVFTQLGIGKFADVDAEESRQVFDWHTSLGLLVLVLMLVRLGWRLTHAVPSLPATTPVWQRGLARTTHLLFYVLLLALPVSGWLLTSAEGEAVRFLGLFPVPGLPVTGGEEAEEIFEEVHELLGNVLIALAALHVLAGWKHHFIDRDSVLRRMLPG
jgi:cytochrome b561